MTFFKPQPVRIRTVNGIELVKATERTATGIFCRIGRVWTFVPNQNIIEWI